MKTCLRQPQILTARCHQHPPGRLRRLPLLLGVLALAAEGDAATMTDNFASRPVVTGASALLTGSTPSARVEVDEPDHDGGRRRTVWGSWRAPANGTAVVDTIGSDFNTVLAVYTGTSLSALLPVALNDNLSSEFNTSRVSFPTDAGESYAIVVDGAVNNANGDGNVRVNVSFTPASQPGSKVGTDAFARRPTLEGARALGVCSTRFGGVEIGEPAGLAAARRTAWWRWVAPANGRVTIDTLQSELNFNTVLTVYVGTELSALSEVAAGGDASNVIQSRVSFQARAGLEYQIRVDGRYTNASGRGNAVLNLVLTPNAQPGAVPGHDTFARRGRLAGANAEGVAMNNQYTTEAGEPDHGSGRKRTVWWEWTAPRDGKVRISTEGTTRVHEGSDEVNTFLAVYRGTALARLQPVASNDNVAGAVWSQVEFEARRGEAYQIMVDGRFANDSGFGNVRLRVDQAVAIEETLAIYPAAELELPGTVGMRYQLQASADLIGWEDLGGPIQGMGEPARVLEGLRGTDRRFYRYVILP